MAEGRRTRRATAVAFSLVAIAAGCGAPSPAATLEDLNRWSSSATMDEDGTRRIQTYENWPMAEAPQVYACATAPTNVFGGDPTRFLPPEEPGCAPFDVTLERGQLTTSIDRAMLPDAFEGLATWTLVMGVTTDEWHWSMSAPMLADIPNPLAPGSGSPAP